jgi:hypothetical protein
MKYNTITYHSKDMAKVKVLKMGQNSRSRSQGKKKLVPIERLRHKEHTSNMKVLSLAIQKIWPMLNFLKSRSNF